MNGILNSVHALSSLIGEIVDAGQAQSSGIERIKSAINKIDGDAQQNAAMVEQTSAASEQLKEQVTTLIESIKVFQAESTSGEEAHRNDSWNQSHGSDPVMLRVA